MAISLFDPQLVISRISSQVPALKSVAGAAQFAAAAIEARILPAAWVIEIANAGARNTLATVAVSQETTVRFGVVLAVQNLRDPRGEKAHADLRAIRESVMTALLGWQPAQDYDGVEYVSGQLLQLDDLVLWWQDVYRSGFTLRSV